MAKEAGFTIPVAVTAAVWNEYIVPTEHLRTNYGQSEDGRLWDTLYMLYARIKRGKASTSRLRFEVSYMLETKLRNAVQRIIVFQSVCHPGDAMEPVITIMLPNED